MVINKFEQRDGDSPSSSSRELQSNAEEQIICRLNTEFLGIPNIRETVIDLLVTSREQVAQKHTLSSEQAENRAQALFAEEYINLVSTFLLTHTDSIFSLHREIFKQPGVVIGYLYSLAGKTNEDFVGKNVYRGKRIAEIYKSVFRKITISSFAQLMDGYELDYAVFEAVKRRSLEKTNLVDLQDTRTLLKHVTANQNEQKKETLETKETPPTFDEWLNQLYEEVPELAGIIELNQLNIQALSDLVAAEIIEIMTLRKDQQLTPDEYFEIALEAVFISIKNQFNLRSIFANEKVEPELLRTLYKQLMRHHTLSFQGYEIPKDSGTNKMHNPEVKNYELEFANQFVVRAKECIKQTACKLALRQRFGVDTVFELYSQNELERNGFSRRKLVAIDKSRASWLTHIENGSFLLKIKLRSRIKKYANRRSVQYFQIVESIEKMMHSKLKGMNRDPILLKRKLELALKEREQQVMENERATIFSYGTDILDPERAPLEQRDQVLHPQQQEYLEFVDNWLRLHPKLEQQYNYTSSELERSAQRIARAMVERKDVRLDELSDYTSVFKKARDAVFFSSDAPFPLHEDIHNSDNPRLFQNLYKMVLTQSFTSKEDTDIQQVEQHVAVTLVRKATFCIIEVYKHLELLLKYHVEFQWQLQETNRADSLNWLYTGNDVLDFFGKLQYFYTKFRGIFKNQTQKEEFVQAWRDLCSKLYDIDILFEDPNYLSHILQGKKSVNTESFISSENRVGLQRLFAVGQH